MRPRRRRLSRLVLAALLTTLTCVGAAGRADAQASYTRIESSACGAVGTWGTQSQAAASASSYRLESVTNKYINCDFEGTQVRYIGEKASNRGIARVFLDWAATSTDADQYNAVTSWQNVLYDSGELACRSHRITIFVSGRRNAASSGYSVGVDAIDYVACTPPSGFATGNAGCAWERGGVAEVDGPSPCDDPTAKSYVQVVNSTASPVPVAQQGTWTTNATVVNTTPIPVTTAAPAAGSAAVPTTSGDPCAWEYGRGLESSPMPCEGASMVSDLTTSNGIGLALLVFFAAATLIVTAIRRSPKGFLS